MNHFILQNIREVEAYEIAKAILNEEITFAQCKETNRFDRPKQQEVLNIIGPKIEEKKLLNTIKNESNASEAIKLCESFLLDFPLSEHIQEVRDIKAKKEEGRAFDFAMRPGSEPQKRIISLKTFLKEHPNGEKAFEVQRTIGELETEIEEAKNLILERIKEGRLSKKEILDHIGAGELSIEDLVPKYISKEGYYHFTNPVYLPFEENENFENGTRKNSTDVFFIGIPGSGKSCLLSGLLFYGDRMYHKTQSIDTCNMVGYHYANRLVEYADRGLIPGGTPVGSGGQKTINYIAANVQDIEYDNYEHQINFVEMSGEYIKEFYEQNRKSINDYELGFKRYLESNNDKYFYIVVDYQANKKQIQYLKLLTDYLKILLEADKKEKTIKAIDIILTKSDLLDGGTHDCELARKYITEESLNNPYSNLYKELITLYSSYRFLGASKESSNLFSRANNKNRKPKIHPFSLGEFELFNVSYKYDPIPSERLYNHIVGKSMATEIRRK